MVICESLPGGTSFDDKGAAGLKDPWEADMVQYQGTELEYLQRGREAIGEGEASAVVEASGFEEVLERS